MAGVLGGFSSGSSSAGPAQPAQGQGKRFDDIPVWDGEDIQEKWPRVRRAIKLWQHDTDIPKEKRGTRLFRNLTGRAAILADSIPDTELFKESAAEFVVDFFDKEYAGFMVLRDEDDYEKTFYTGHRLNDESFVLYCQRKLAEMGRFENNHSALLPDFLQGRQTLKAFTPEPRASAKYQHLVARQTCEG